ncbi:MAG: bifunctional diaminohydroxyphosphoribosylaminopyrimidine deaminase/5-amino-6-(5-phosphoribosylamino)uracil reductase RibD [Candidatus Eremiobacteraeota bacterium]|nr:bifunctional diaminohydroxyphosphoribosylaminopyrimidine deaminase/5-amino-6-(5-phosphoribosylamino)uracil reductase RibD [Candidatus Eremiobacteraeota bacterium]
MESSRHELTPLDRLFLQRAYELAARGIGGTSPNPPVGAVVVRGGHVVGEGYHRRAGDAHAERIALARAGSNVPGATVYVSLEPCGHTGRTPPCTDALIEAGVARVVAGLADPSERGGAAELRRQGIDVTIADDPVARDLIEIFARGLDAGRPFVALKMAMSLDGMVASCAGVRERLSSEAEERYVRELRTVYDAVLVGAGTARIDDPLLTVRPPHSRARPYVRIIACEDHPISMNSRALTAEPGYATTIILAPAALRDRFDTLRGVADVMEIGTPTSAKLDLTQAFAALRSRGILSVLCEGGPRLAASLLASKMVDRLYWAIAPRFLRNENSVPVVCGTDLSGVHARLDRITRLGSDILISAVPCHPEPVEG